MGSEGANVINHADFPCVFRLRNWYGTGLDEMKFKVKTVENTFSFLAEEEEGPLPSESITLPDGGVGNVELLYDNYVIWSLKIM